MAAVAASGASALALASTIACTSTPATIVVAWPGPRRRVVATVEARKELPCPRSVSPRSPGPTRAVSRRNQTSMCSAKDSKQDHPIPPHPASDKEEQDPQQQASSKAMRISAAMKTYWRSERGSLVKEKKSKRRLRANKKSTSKETEAEKGERPKSLREESGRFQDDETRAIISETATLIWAVRTAKNIGAFENLVVIFLLEVSESARSQSILKTLLSLYFDKIAVFMAGMSPYTLASVSRRYALFADFCRVRNYKSMPAAVESIKEYFQYLELRGTIAPRTALYYVYPIKKMHEFVGIPFPKVNISKLRKSAMLELTPAVKEDLATKYFHAGLLEPSEDWDKTALAKTSDQSMAYQSDEKRHQQHQQQEEQNDNDNNDDGSANQNDEEDEAEVDTDLQLDAEMEEALQSYISSNELESEGKPTSGRAQNDDSGESDEDLQRVAEYLKISQTIRQWKMTLRLNGQLSDNPDPLEEEEVLSKYARSIGRKGVALWKKFKAFRP